MKIGANRLAPGEQEIRAALERIVASAPFRGSAQLIAFLRFIVEAVLTGRTDEIKGYTIAVKALGRGEDFNPKTDAIVRVEAGRLRRAIERYYAEPGADDPVEIEIPARGYVPVFRHREAPRDHVKGASRLQRLATQFASVGRRYAAALALVALGAAIYGAADYWYFGDRSKREVIYLTSATTDAPAPQRWRARPVGPVIYIEPVRATGTPAQPTIAATALYDRLRDAFASFDDVTVSTEGAGANGVAPALPPTAADYRLSASLEYNADRTVSIDFQLVDAINRTIVWTKSFDRVSVADDPRAIKNPIVREVTTTLLPAHGIINARERVKLATARDFDPRYRCELDAADYWRSYDSSLHAGVRACLEQAIADDPTFASGYALLSRIYLREFQFGDGGAEAGDVAMLERAQKMARRALEIKPNSACARAILGDVLIARGQIEEGLAAGEAAVALNPFDPIIATHYGNQLITLGEVDKGLAVLEPVAAPGRVNPTRFELSLFLASYLKGDFAAASQHASRLPSNTLSLAFVARALAAYKRGNSDSTRQALARLAELYPAWRADPRKELSRIIPSAKIVDQLAQDLTAATAAVN